MALRTRLIAGFVIALSVAAVVVLLRPAVMGAASPTGTSTASNAPAAQGKTSTEAVLAIAPSARAVSPAKTVSNAMTPLMREFVDSKNDKAIYQRLMTQPTWTAEEEYVLAKILDRCADVTDRKESMKRKPEWSLGGADARARFAASLSSRAPNRDKRIAAFDAINFDECAGMEGVKTTEKEIGALYDESAARGDPKSRIESMRRAFDDQRRDAKGDIDWTKPVSISEAQLAAWKDVFSSADARAIMDAIQLFTFNSSIHLRGPDEAPIDWGALSNASILAACDLGRYCGPDARYLQQACAMEGQCDAADVRDYILFYGSTPSSSQLAVEYQARLMDVIRRGDWSYFTIVRGPPPILAPYQRR
jgi:hypothetical protein